MVIPVESVTNKEEYSTASFRTKVQRLLPDYLQPMNMTLPEKSSLNLRVASFPLDDLKKSVEQLSIDKTVKMCIRDRVIPIHLFLLTIEPAALLKLLIC